MLLAVFKVSGQVEYMVTVNPATGAFSRVDNLPGVAYISVVPNATAFDRVNHRYIFRGSDAAMNWYLYTVDAPTGKIILHPPFPKFSNALDNLMEFRYDNSAGILYGVHWNESQKKEYLVSIDTATGSFKKISSLPGVQFIVSFNTTCDEVHHRYIFSGIDDQNKRYLYTVDAVTGKIIYQPVFATFTTPGNQIQDLQYDNATNTLYGLYMDNALKTYYLIKIDQVTGAFSKISSLPGVTGMAGVPNYTVFDEIHHRFIFQGVDNVGWCLYSLDATTGKIISKPPFPVLQCPGDNLIEPRFDNTSGVLYSLHWANRLPLARVIPTQVTICYGGTYKLNAGYRGAKRKWSTGDTAQIIEVGQTGKYWVHTEKDCYESQDTVDVNDLEKLDVELGPDRTICSGDSSYFQAKTTVPGLRYQWTLPRKNANGQPVILKQNILWAKDSGMYTIKVANAAGCVNLDTVYVRFFPLPRPDAGIDTEICYGSTIFLKGRGGITYLWTPADYLDNAKISNPKASPPKTQKYVLTISDADGCVAHDTVWLNVKPPLRLDLNAREVKTCKGGNVLFTATARGGLTDGKKIEWLKKGDTVWKEGNSSQWKADSSFSIAVRLRDGCSRDYIDTVNVVAIDTPGGTISIIPGKGCEPLAVKTNVTGDTAGLSFAWDMGDGTHYTTPEPVHIYLKNGKYRVTTHLTNRITGCSSLIVQPGEVIVLEKPKAEMDFTPAGTDLFHPQVTFTDKSKNTVAGRWVIDGAVVSDKPIYTHTFPDTGYYTMRLVAYNQDGCTDTASGRVYIREPFVVYIPNSFTPGNDGINDVFRPMLKGVAMAPMQIYNRWGERVFDGDALQGWDGSFEGKPCTPDVYLYMIQVRGREGERKYCSGSVTLMK